MALIVLKQNRHGTGDDVVKFTGGIALADDRRVRRECAPMTEHQQFLDRLLQIHRQHRRDFLPANPSSATSAQPRRRKPFVGLIALL